MHIRDKTMTERELPSLRAGLRLTQDQPSADDNTEAAQVAVCAHSHRSPQLTLAGPSHPLEEHSVPQSVPRGP